MKPCIWIALVVAFALGCGGVGENAVDSDGQEADAGPDQNTGDGNEGQECEFYSALPNISACLTDGQEAPTEGWIMESTAEVSGTVIATGTGAPPVNCFDRETYPGREVSGVTTNGRWIQVEDADGTTWTAAFVAPSLELDVAVGDSVDISYYCKEDMYLPEESNVHVRSGDRLVVWFALSETLGGFKMPEGLQLQRGDELCEVPTTGGCGSWAMYQMLATTDGATEEVPLDAGLVDVGDFRVLNGGLRTDTDTEMPCPDAYWGYFSALVLPAS